MTGNFQMSNLQCFLAEERRTILYYGASVTVQRDGFRPLLHALMCKDSGIVHNELINGVGGVGSLFCLGNIINTVPENTQVDVVVHECFTGDTHSGITSLALLPVYLEEFLKVFPASKHLFLLNFRADRTLEELRQVAQVYEEFCTHKNLPLIKVFETFHGDGVPGLTVDQAFRDGVHPTPIGATFIAQTIWDEVRQFTFPVATGSNPPVAAALAASQVQYYGVDYLKRHIDTQVVEGEFVYKNTGQVFQYLEFDTDIQLHMPPGQILGMLALTGPRSPAFVHIDLGGPVRKFRTFDRNCFYTRPQTFSWPGPVAQKQFCLSMLPEAPDFLICSRDMPEFKLPRSFALCGVYMLDAARAKD